ncbi:MAG: L-threonylcarbamoyladenylate synthase [Candidatus Yanofskybacteria bacterium]|nr:L-threonylcarbamoyladenylate synthase [Candidatus Yanofskybacteria bacterium]
MRIIQVYLEKDYLYALREAISVLSQSGVIVYPTDTLYALGGNALDHYVVDKIFRIKQRKKTKPLPVFVKNIMWAHELAHINERNELILNKIWPGKITAVLPKKEIVPNILTAGANTVGMRMSNFELVDRLLGKFGYPITSTAANISGEEPSLNINSIIESLRSSPVQPDLVLDIGNLSQSHPSTVLDLTTDKPKIVRVGATTPKQLLELLEV